MSQERKQKNESFKKPICRTGLVWARPWWQPTSTYNPKQINLPAVHIVQLHFKNGEPNFDRISITNHNSQVYQ